MSTESQKKLVNEILKRYYAKKADVPFSETPNLYYHFFNNPLGFNTFSQLYGLNKPRQRSLRRLLQAANDRNPEILIEAIYQSSLFTKAILKLRGKTDLAMAIQETLNIDDSAPEQVVKVMVARKLNDLTTFSSQPLETLKLTLEDLERRSEKNWQREKYQHLQHICKVLDDNLLLDEEKTSLIKNLVGEHIKFYQTIEKLTDSKGLIDTIKPENLDSFFNYGLELTVTIIRNLSFLLSEKGKPIRQKLREVAAKGLTLHFPSEFVLEGSRFKASRGITAPFQAFMQGLSVDSQVENEKKRAHYFKAFSESIQRYAKDASSENAKDLMAHFARALLVPVLPEYMDKKGQSECSKLENYQSERFAFLVVDMLNRQFSKLFVALIEPEQVACEEKTTSTTASVRMPLLEVLNRKGEDADAAASYV